MQIMLVNIVYILHVKVHTENQQNQPISARLNNAIYLSTVGGQTFGSQTTFGKLPHKNKVSEVILSHKLQTLPSTTRVGHQVYHASVFCVTINYRV